MIKSKYALMIALIALILGTVNGVIIERNVLSWDKACCDNLDSFEEEFRDGKEFVAFQKYRIYPIKDFKNRYHYVKVWEGNQIALGLCMTVLETEF